MLSLLNATVEQAHQRIVSLQEHRLEPFGKAMRYFMEAQMKLKKKNTQLELGVNKIDNT